MRDSAWWKSRQVLFGLQALISVALLGWLISTYWNELRNAAARLSLSVLAVAVLVLATSQVWGGLRLWVLARNSTQSLPPFAAIRMTFLGFFVGSFLPSTIGGDFARGVAMVRLRFGGAEAAVVLLVDRMINTMIILALAAISVPIAFGSGNTGNSQIIAAVVLAGGLVAAMLLAPQIAGRLDRFPQQHRFSSLAAALGRAARRIPRHPGILAVAVLLSLASVGASLAAQWIIATSIGLPLSFTDLTAIVCLVYVVTLLPISVNGLGVQEASLTSLLVALGAEPSAGVAFALAVRVIMIGLAALSGLALFGSWSGPAQDQPRS